MKKMNKKADIERKKKVDIDKVEVIQAKESCERFDHFGGRQILSGPQAILLPDRLCVMARTRWMQSPSLQMRRRMWRRRTMQS
jgi:hypothetical protein